MSIDCRTRRHLDRRDLSRDEIFDSILPEAADLHGTLARRGILYKGLPSLGLRVDGRSLTLRVDESSLTLEDGERPDSMVAELSVEALSNLVQDWKTTMGLAMISQVSIVQGEFGHWVGWEPVFRALLDGRPVHEAGAIDFKDLDGSPLDLTRRFTLEDDPSEAAHFLQEAGFLHVRGVFAEEEMAAVSADLDEALSQAERDDGASWWAGDSSGTEHPVRVLFFQERSPTLRALLQDDRFQWLGTLTGDSFNGGELGAEGLIKPLDIQTGLSDLPWHKDCGQGGHSYYCNGLTAGISVTGADRRSGALGVVPGSHRANVQIAGKDESLDMPSLKLETRTGDVTVHCSDTLHRAHRPTECPRKVVYSGFRLRLKPGDALESIPVEKQRADRAQLTDVQGRIAESGAGAEATECVEMAEKTD